VKRVLLYIWGCAGQHAAQCACSTLGLINALLLLHCRVEMLLLCVPLLG
jgi:hypothetical protein